MSLDILRPYLFTRMFCISFCGVGGAYAWSICYRFAEPCDNEHGAVLRAVQGTLGSSHVRQTERKSEEKRREEKRREKERERERQREIAQADNPFPSPFLSHTSRPNKHDRQAAGKTKTNLNDGRLL